MKPHKLPAPGEASRFWRESDLGRDEVDSIVSNLESGIRLWDQGIGKAVFYRYLYYLYL